LPKGAAFGVLQQPSKKGESLFLTLLDICEFSSIRVKLRAIILTVEVKAAAHWTSSFSNESETVQCVPGWSSASQPVSLSLNIREPQIRSCAPELENERRVLGRDLSFGQQQLAMRASMLAILLEDRECRALLGQKIDVNDYAQLLAAQTRIFKVLGIRRTLKNVPNLNEYIEQNYTEEETAA
jgi:hypothetical protein